MRLELDGRDGGGGAYELNVLDWAVVPCWFNIKSTVHSSNTIVNRTLLRRAHFLVL